MKKYFPHISAFILTFVLVFAVSGFVFSQTASAQPAGSCPGDQVSYKGVCISIGPTSGEQTFIGSWWDTLKCVASPFDCALRNFITTIVGIVLRLVSLLTWLSGILLNGAVYYTVVQVSENYSKIPAINEAWGTIRDLANMAFIFVLLYAAIQTILGIGQDTKKLIVRVVVVAILINFSLFFTKVVIDISNILALLFYEAIVGPAALSATATFDVISQGGLSNALMQHLSLQSLYDAQHSMTIMSIITVGIMGSIMLLIASFVFFAVAIMFIIRYVILILVLILSPLAFIAFILPALKDKQKQWTDALIGQAFFAPIYFMLTWVTVKILAGVMKANTFGGSADETTASLATLLGASTGNNLSTGAFAMFMNYIVVIVFLITSLIIAKEWASKLPGGASKLASWATGAAGGATIGMVGRFGRKTVGSWGNATANDEELKARARQGDMGARLKLATASRMAKSSFDIRGTGIGGTLDAGKAQKGGFIQDQKDRAKAFEKYKPSKDATDKLKAEEDKAQGELINTAGTAVPKSAEHFDAEERLRDLRRTSTRGLSDEQVKARVERIKVIQEEVDSHKEELAQKRKVHIDTAPELEEVRRRRDTNKTARQNLESSMENMEEASKRRERSVKIFGYAIPASGYIVGGKDRAAAIRAAAKGKSAKDKAADILKDLQKEGVIPEEEKPETPPPTPPTPPPPPPTP